MPGIQLTLDPIIFEPGFQPWTPTQNVIFFLSLLPRSDSADLFSSTVGGETVMASKRENKHVKLSILHSSHCPMISVLLTQSFIDPAPHISESAGWWYI
jgi:hypothetical protein